jgi:hypothetical protein
VTNPLVAAPARTSPSPWAGAWIAEDIEQIIHGVQSGSWIDGALGAVGTGLDALALAFDPIGGLLQYGIAWLIEHVKPLSEALDWLAGDPAAIAAHAQTWRNVAGSLRTEADAVIRAARFDVSEWTGAAGDAYRNHAGHRSQALDALGRAADGMALITEGVGALIGTVRLMVRDAVATVVSRLIVYAGELIATAGLATPFVAGQVSTLCASWAAKIARWLKGLIASIRRIGQSMIRLGRDIDEIKGTTGGSPAPSPAPHEPPSGRPRFDGMSGEDLVRDRGANIGRPGSGPKVREVESEADLQAYFDALTRGGYTDRTPPGFPGRMVELPDGTIVNWRTRSKSTGGIPTVDVNPGNGESFKIHINPNGW